MKRLVFLLFCSIILMFSFVSAMGVNIPVSTTTPTTNYSLVNVNNSQYLQGLTPAQVANLYVENDPSFTSWLSTFLYNYNQTGLGGTYNVTYNSWAYNQTYSGSIFNSTYANKQNSITNNITLTDSNGYNLTITKNSTGAIISYQTNFQGGYGTAMYHTGTGGGAINSAFTGWNNISGSYSLWINPLSITTCQDNSCMILNSANTAGDGGIYVRIANGNTMTFRFNGKDASITPPSLNTWTHFVYTWNVTADKAMVYQNGINIINATAGLTSMATTPIQISLGANAVGFRTYNGSVDELAMYSGRVLTPAEALTIYNSGIGTLTANTETNVKALYHFDEASGSFTDSSGNNNNLTVTSPMTRATGIVRTAGTQGGTVNLIQCISGTGVGEQAICYYGGDNQRMYLRGSEIYWGNSTMSFGSINALNITATKFTGDGSGLTNIGASRNALIYQDGAGNIKSNNLTGLFYNDLNSLLTFFGWKPNFNLTDYSTGLSAIFSKESFKSKVSLKAEVNNLSTSTGNALKINGTTGGLASNTFTGWNGTVGSISVWVNASSTSCGGTICTVLNSNNAGSDGLTYMRMNGGMTLRTCGQSISTTVPAGNYTHLVMTWDVPANQLKAYNNGVLISTTTCADWSGSSAISVGALNSGGQRFFNGTIDELAIYKGRALTQGDINNLYNNGTGWKVPSNDQSLGALYHFDEVSGNALDNSSNGNTLTISTWQYSSGLIQNYGSKKLLDVVNCEDGKIAGENGIITLGDANARTVINGQNITINNNLSVVGNYISYGQTGISRNVSYVKNESLAVDFLLQTFTLTPTYCYSNYTGGILVWSDC